MPPSSETLRLDNDRSPLKGHHHAHRQIDDDTVADTKPLVKASDEARAQDNAAAARALLRVHNVAVHLGVVGLQTKGGSTNDYSTHPDGGLRWLSSDVS